MERERQREQELLETDLDRIGGVPVVLKHLLEEGLLHGDEVTVTGKTMAENLAEIDPPGADGIVVHPIDAPIHSAPDVYCVHTRPWCQGDTDAGRHHQFMALDIHGRGQRIEQALTAVHVYR